MKRVLNIAWTVIQVLIIIYVILIIAFMNISNKYGYGEIGKYVIDVDNNEFLIIKKTNDIKVGDLVYYYSIVDGKYRITYSNVKSIDDNKLHILDNEEDITKNKIIGKSYRTVPIIGFVLNNVKEKINFLLFVLFPILTVFIYQVYRFIIDINSKKSKKKKE